MVHLFLFQELAKQNFSEQYTSTEDIVQLNRTVLDELSKENCDIFVNNRDKLTRKVNTLDLAVHPTIIQLIKMYPKLKIPNDVLKAHIQPSVLLDRSEAENWTPPSTNTEIVCIPETSAIERFKLMCPQISIVKVSEDTTATETQYCVDSLNNLESKTSKSPCNVASDVSIRKRSDSITSESSAKKRRLNSPIISSTNNDEQISKLDVSLNKPRPETPPVQQTCNRLTLPPTPTLNTTHAIDINNEADVERIIPKTLRNEDGFLKSDTEDSDYQPDMDEDSDLSDYCLDTIDEEIAINCEFCSRIFNTRQQLRSHERVHRQCTICNEIFRTCEIRQHHQQEICFKHIIENSPKLELTRVDDIPEVVEAFPSAFIPEQKDTIEIQPINVETTVISDDDDDVILIEDNRTTTNTQISTSNAYEYSHIWQIFKKYQDVNISCGKDKHTETKPRVNIKYNWKNQIVLENMFTELQSYRIPVELIAKPTGNETSFAYVSFTKEQKKSKDIFCWANEPVIGLNENRRLLNALLRDKPFMNDIETEVESSALSHVEISQPFQATPLNVNTQILSQLLQVPSMSQIVNKQSVSDNVVIDLNENDTDSESIPSTSRLDKETTFSLRVKTLSELNTL